MANEQEGLLEPLVGEDPPDPQAKRAEAGVGDLIATYELLEGIYADAVVQTSELQGVHYATGTSVPAVWAP
ncbi:MAG: hypothetical protein ACREN1_08365 [Candidatus Dormibacteria bacterium]